MKYVVIIPDGAAGWPLETHDSKTSLELANKPNLDMMVRQGKVGMARTVPEGMEPSSACACMSIMGYDPQVYFTGRGPIEAKSLGLELEEGEVAFRCNFVTIENGKMRSFNAGHITDSESHPIIDSLNEALGIERIRFHPGVGYRHILTIKNGEDCLGAVCTPPHDIPDQPVEGKLPSGAGSELLLELMEKSKGILANHPVNVERISRGKLPATMIWLFWGGRGISDFPSFVNRFGLKAAMTSGVGLLEGLADLTGMKVLKIAGVTDNIDNDYDAQGEGALKALDDHDIVFVHVEAPDESGHEALIEEKIRSIEQIDKKIVSKFVDRKDLRILVMPDHPTPLKLKTHTGDPVPFVMWGPGIESNGAMSFSENSAQSTGFYIEHADDLIGILTAM